MMRESVLSAGQPSLDEAADVMKLLMRTFDVSAAVATASWLTREVVSAQLRYQPSRTQVSRQLE